MNIPKRTWARFSPVRFIYAFSRLNFRRMEECATIVRWLDARHGEHILDIGCGDGAYDKKISGTGATVQGIDIHEKRLSAAFSCFRRTAFPPPGSRSTNGRIISGSTR